jgi:hypothetical protein
VYCGDARIAQNLSIIGGGRLNCESVTESSRRFDSSTCDGYRFDESHSPNGFEVDAAHETGSEDRCLY